MVSSNGVSVTNESTGSEKIMTPTPAPQPSLRYVISNYVNKTPVKINLSPDTCNYVYLLCRLIIHSFEFFSLFDLMRDRCVHVRAPRAFLRPHRSCALGRNSRATSVQRLRLQSITERYGRRHASDRAGKKSRGKNPECQCDSPARDPKKKP